MLLVRNLPLLKPLMWRSRPLRERPIMFFPWYTIVMLGLEVEPSYRPSLDEACGRRESRAG
jgi:hypothetical protein